MRSAGKTRRGYLVGDQLGRPQLSSICTGFISGRFYKMPFCRGLNWDFLCGGSVVQVSESSCGDGVNGSRCGG